MRHKTVLACLTAACLAAACLAGAAPADAQRSLFDQTPADPSSGFAPPAATVPAPAPALVPPPSSPAATPAPAPAAPRAAAPRATRAAAPVSQEETGAEPAPPRTKPRAAAKPKGPQAASAITIVNGSTATVTNIAITADTKSVDYKKPLAPDARAVVKLPKFKGCSITVVPTFGTEGSGNSGEVNVCKDKIVRLTE